MSGLLIRLLVLLLPALCLAAGTGSPAQAAPAASTYVTMTSEPGDYIGQGQHRLFREGADEVSVGGTVTEQVTVRVARTGTSESFSLTFAAAPGQALAVGDYPAAQRTPFRVPGHPGIDISGSGRGCNTIEGEFSVLDIAPDLSRLWITYEQHCEGGDEALFGEIRYGVPGGDSELLVAPGRIVWPDEYPGVQGRSVPVKVVNTGTETVDVSDALLSNTDDFWVDNGCGPLAPGDTCSVYVGFVPTTAGAHTGTLTVVTSLGARTVTLAGEGIGGHTSWAMHSQPGDWVGQGRDWSYSPATASITAEGGPGQVQLSVEAAGSWFTAEFEPEAGRQLVAGSTFTGATRYPFNSTSVPGLSVSGTGRGCNTLTGRFTVHEAEYVAGEVTAFSVTFEQHCEGSTPALLGSIVWHSDTPAQPVPDVTPVDTTPPAAVTNLVATPGTGSASYTWTDPADPDWADTVVRGAPGLTAPATVTAGTSVYVGRAGAASVAGVPAGSAYSISVFTRDAAGNVSPARSVTVRGSALTLTVTAAKGNQSVLAGRLTDAHTGSGVPAQPVTVWSRRPGGTWTLLTTLASNATGSWSVTVKPGTPTEYQARFAGGGSSFGAASPVVGVKK